jgi:hypothetical protein
MDHILNLRAVMERLNKKPVGQRLYHFFWGTTQLLSVDEIKDIKKVAEKEHRQLISYLDKAMAENRKKQIKKVA